MDKLVVVFAVCCLVIQATLGAEDRPDCGIDCGADHCCARLWLPGRKRLFAMGYCQILKREGQRCIPGGTAHDCPCGSGLNCLVEDGNIEGICRSE